MVLSRQSRNGGGVIPATLREMNAAFCTACWAQYQNKPKVVFSWVAKAPQDIYSCMHMKVTEVAYI